MSKSQPNKDFVLRKVGAPQMNKTVEKGTKQKTYEEPTVQKVEFDFKTRITASLCAWTSDVEYNCEPAEG